MAPHHMEPRVSLKATVLTKGKTLPEGRADLDFFVSGEWKRHFAFRAEGNFSVMKMFTKKLFFKKNEFETYFEIFVKNGSVACPQFLKASEHITDGDLESAWGAVRRNYLIGLLEASLRHLRSN